MSHTSSSFSIAVGALLLALVFGARVASAQCIGDCNGNGHVDTTELKDGVQIGLLQLLPSACPAYSDAVEVDDLVTAVNNQIDGCPATPTPSPTSTSTSTLTPTQTSTPVPTTTPGGVSNAVAGGAAVVAKTLGGVPSLITAIVTGLSRGSAPAALVAGEGGGAGACPLGGSASRSCSSGPPVTLTLGLSQCALETPDGTLTLTTTSDISLMAQFGLCPSVLVPPINATADILGTYRDMDSMPTLNTRATLTAVVETLQIPVPTPVCVVTGAKLKATGNLTSALPPPAVGGAVLTFLQTTVDLAITASNSDCVPIEYTLTFNGPAQVRDTSTAAEVADITFTDFVVMVDASGSPTTLDMTGTLNFDCLAGAIALDTVTALSAIPGELCPNSGKINIQSPEGASVIQYSSDGSVQVDVNNDGDFDDDIDNVFPSCIDPMLQLCPQ